MKNKSIAFTVILGFFCLTNFSYSQDLLIKNGSVLTVTQGKMVGADILIQNGIITKIGQGIEAPDGIRIIDASGKFVIPGIIDTHTHIALSGTNEGSESITSEVNMRDVLDAEDTGIYTALSGGVTMIHTLHGSANAIAGENITLKMKWGKPAEDLIVHDAYRTLKFALGENPKRANSVNPDAPVRYPQTRMGVNAIIRREFMKARNYMEQWDRYNALKNSKKPPVNLIPPKRDLRLEPRAVGRNAARQYSGQMPRLQGRRDDRVHQSFQRIRFQNRLFRTCLRGLQDRQGAGRQRYRNLRFCRQLGLQG